MKIIALDISTSAGWALLQGEMGQQPTILKTGLVKNPKTVAGYGKYPYSYWFAANSVSMGMADLLPREEWLGLDAVIVEETNLGRARYTQKILEFTHCITLAQLADLGVADRVKYINTGDWRRTLGIQLTKEDKRNNLRVRRAKQSGNRDILKALGIRGKIGKKHLALRYVYENFGLALKVKDDDIADAICLGTAYFLGSPLCDGT